MISLNDFANSLCKPCTRPTCNVVWVWHTSKFYLIHTVTPMSVLEFAAASKSSAYFKGLSLESVPCGFSSMLSIDTLACENCSLHIKIFR